MGALRTMVIDRIYRGHDPFVGFPEGLYVQDMQGWQSQHPILRTAAARRNPILIVEIGVWKGGSTITMADTIRKNEADGVVIAVDTWLGSWEHWLNDGWFSALGGDHGYPTLQ